MSGTTYRAFSSAEINVHRIDKWHPDSLKPNGKTSFDTFDAARDALVKSLDVQIARLTRIRDQVATTTEEEYFRGF